MHDINPLKFVEDGGAAPPKASLGKTAGSRVMESRVGPWLAGWAEDQPLSSKLKGNEPVEPFYVQ